MSKIDSDKLKEDI